MQTSVTKLGQTIIPATIRSRYDIQPGDHLVWVDDGTTIKIVPVPAESRLVEAKPRTSQPHRFTVRIRRSFAGSPRRFFTEV